MTFTICNELFVDRSNAQSFEDNFGASMKGTLPKVEGLIGARLLAPTDPDRGYLSVLEFANEEAYNQYLSSEWFAAAHNWPEHAPIESNKLTTYNTTLTL